VPSPTSSVCPSWTWAACPSPRRPWPCCPQRRPAARAVPVTLAHDVLTVALADPTNVLALDDIRLATKLASVRTAVATASDVQEAVNRYYGGAAAGGVGDTFGALADVEGLEAGEKREEELEAVGDVDHAPVVRLVNAIMGEALHSRASDIHIEPQERDVRVRYRTDGLLREVTVGPQADPGAADLPGQDPVGHGHLRAAQAPGRPGPHQAGPPRGRHPGLVHAHHVRRDGRHPAAARR
jgi:hypothetical protein